MKLKRIKLYDDFRSLQNGFELNFVENYEEDKDNNAIEPYCIVGRNGSGKSNILELLSAIFYQVEVNYLNFLPKEKVEDKYTENGYGEEGYTEDFNYQELEIFQSSHTNPNAYKLEYYITLNKEVKLVTIEKALNKDIKLYTDSVDRPLYGDNAKKLLPLHIVGYSSGQNEILSLPFFKMRLIEHDEYIDSLSKKIKFYTPESRMIYLDDNFSQAIFATNFIFNDGTINEIFSQTIGIESLESFRIVIKTKLKIDVVVETENGLIDESRLLIDEFSDNINLLKSCSTMYYEDIKNEELILDFYIDDNGEMQKAFKEKFYEKDSLGMNTSHLKLFQTFQTLINLNYYHIEEETKHRLYKSKSLFAKGYLPQTSWNNRFFTFKNFMIKKKDIKESIYSRSLSDGEYQFLHSIGLALIYRGTQSLFLLDEPETHFNPSWRAEYMSVLKKCFKGTNTKAEFLITSHSPFIISDTHKEKVLIFEKEKGKVERKIIDDFNTFGASVNEITDVIFNRQETIGNLSLKELNDSIKSINTIEDYNKAKMILNKLGDSIEKFDAYNYLNKRKKEIN